MKPLTGTMIAPFVLIENSGADASTGGVADVLATDTLRTAKVRPVGGGVLAISNCDWALVTEIEKPPVEVPPVPGPPFGLPHAAAITA
jgi:hypothetical protein